LIEYQADAEAFVRGDEKLLISMSSQSQSILPMFQRYAKSLDLDGILDKQFGHLPGESLVLPYALTLTREIEILPSISLSTDMMRNLDSSDEAYCLCVRKEGIVIYTIGIGSQQGAPIPEFDRYGNRTGYKKDRQGEVVTTRMDVLTLEKIAFETGGKYYISSTGESELDKIYGEIAEMEEKQLSSRQFTQFEDRFQVFLLITLILLVIETLFSERRKIKQMGRQSIIS